MGGQPRHHLQRPLAQPLALSQQPLLERRLLQAQAGQEVALVEPGGLREGLGRSLRRTRLEPLDVARDPRRVESDLFAVDPQDIRVPEAAPQPRERLA
jgi:hypothetical protein